MADSNDIAALSRQLLNLATQMEQLAPEVADAKTVKEYDSDRRKALLAVHVAPLLVGNSASAAEHIARASAAYATGMKTLQQNLLTAHTALAKADALQCRFEAVRSVLSVQKATLAL